MSAYVNIHFIGSRVKMKSECALIHSNCKYETEAWITSTSLNCQWMSMKEESFFKENVITNVDIKYTFNGIEKQTRNWILKFLMVLTMRSYLYRSHQIAHLLRRCIDHDNTGLALTQSNIVFFDIGMQKWRSILDTDVKCTFCAAKKDDQQLIIYIRLYLPAVDEFCIVYRHDWKIKELRHIFVQSSIPNCIQPSVFLVH